VRAGACSPAAAEAEEGSAGEVAVTVVDAGSEGAVEPWNRGEEGLNRAEARDAFGAGTG
jgi:hypothetical protein